MRGELVRMTIYWGGVDGKFPAEQSDPCFYGSWSEAEKAATNVAKLNSGTMDRIERAVGECRVYGSTPFGPFEAVVRRLA